ncbi:Signal transduction histidine kinase [Saccharopolyspora antimicrobica]|uniref:histidine kinase n=1 Tax=Saccharopolyspora antimicrobica TaxID=455193 RepID=A0A1I4XLE3_9PSEU|nr:histidine kinase [Saccharopolyspora antimicrobica]RKT84540.1 signal transduction histidine kinase [Saccharopolyspora antimicrobica]SFN26060.1 Signal transduction histidine kinase [Saccharopolyspora antimicrobica]
MRKLSLWLQAHPVVGDGAIAAFMLLLQVAETGSQSEQNRLMFWLLLPVHLLVTVPIAFRRVWPIRSAYAALLASAVLVAVQEDAVVGALVQCVMIYTLVAYTTRRVGALYTLLVGVLFLVELFIGLEPTDDLAQLLIVQIMFFVMLVGFCWALGAFIGARRAYLAEVERRLRNLEFERDQQARIAVAEERNRIAREIHDVLAHSISVMVTQADGAGYAMSKKPELAERALQTISATGREALSELRGLLGVLRNPGEHEPDRIPQPTAANLHDLVDRVRALGVTTSLELTGDFTGLPAGIGLSVYRIVQESLTNVVKHGGTGAKADVRAVNDGRCIDIEVVDAGTASLPSDLASGGNGLIGMRERAVVYGGTLEAGPRPGGGWRVHAVLPLEPP